MVEDTNNICTENSATLCSNILARFGRISIKLDKMPNFKRYSFRKCRWILAYWSLSKLEKYHGWIYSSGDAAHVYTSFSQPLIRWKQLGGNWLNTYARRLQKLVNRALAKRLVGETTVNRIGHDWESSTSVWFLSAQETEWLYKGKEQVWKVSGILN